MSKQISQPDGTFCCLGASESNDSVVPDCHLFQGDGTFHNKQRVERDLAAAVQHLTWIVIAEVDGLLLVVGWVER